MKKAQAFGRIQMHRVVKRGHKEKLLLDDVSVSVEAGELVAIIGESGAGKTTLLRVMAGMVAADKGAVRTENISGGRGYVPQDDIVHRELSVETTLSYAARLRLPDSSPLQRAKRIQDVLSVLGLEEHRQARVAALSGGQRKRVSIAVEMLVKPQLFFLDEPTSGLDPTTGRMLVQTLRRLAGVDGRTVVFTTHAMADVADCDRVIVMSRGAVVFSGAPADARAYFKVDGFADIYDTLGCKDTAAWQKQYAKRHAAAPIERTRTTTARRHLRPFESLRQWTILTQRTAELLVRNKLTLAILLGAPAMVITMFAMLFRSGAFAFSDPSPQVAVMIVFWIAFGGFFFGLTYGLSQICTEWAVFRRERFVGLRVAPYVLSKVAVLLPVLVIVNAAMLSVLRATDRLPALDAGTYLAIGVTAILGSAAALAMGLLGSALVSEPSQATLTLPMFCFPQVLFSGAILPVPLMAAIGEGMSYVLSVRWTFEAIGQQLRLPELFSSGASPLGPPLLESYGNTFVGPVRTDWLILAAMTLVLLVATTWVCRLRSR